MNEFKRREGPPESRGYKDLEPRDIARLVFDVANEAMKLMIERLVPGDSGDNAEIRVTTGRIQSCAASVEALVYRNLCDKLGLDEDSRSAGWQEGVERS